jgi:hypothetical protein
MTSLTLADVEGAVKAWLTTTPVGNLVARGSSYNVFLAMPTGSPLPSVTLYRVGGAPDESVMPRDLPVIRFHCWAAHRPQAFTIAKALVEALEDLVMSGGYVVGGCQLRSAQTLLVRWHPDPTSDVPRYFIEASFHVVTV